MQKIKRLLQKAWTILTRRFKNQGIGTTLLWLYGRGMSGLTGIPVLQFSRVTDNLYVGSQYNAFGKRLLARNGIDACVNMRIEHDDAAFGLALPRYLHLPTIDDDAPSVEHLDRGVEFISQVIGEGGKVYIHCGAGVGRAPSMAAAYLIAEGHSLEEALALIRKVRPFIWITAPQMEQLKKYEERCRANGKQQHSHSSLK